MRSRDRPETADSGDAMPRQTFLSSRFHYTFGQHEPTLTVRSGTSLRVVCPDSDNRLGDGTVLSRDQRQQDQATPLMEGNPMAGPIRIEGAEPGDCVAIYIEAIHLDRATGQTGLTPGHGLLPPHLLARSREGEADEVIPRHVYEWHIDPQAGFACLANPLGKHSITVPLDPFIGCIGVCPEWGQAISTLYAGSHGGNMDIPVFRAGATLYLPVHRSGALLMLGDLHAAQGHGEIIGGAIETSGKVDCTISLIQRHAIEGPRVRDAAQLVTIATAGELRSACQQAYAQLLNWLVDDLSMNRWDAYNLISQAGTTTLGSLLYSPYIAGAGIPLAVLPEAAQKKMKSWRA
jgi:acetamidase/formamidase